MIITIEGNIGAGKSVFAESLCSLLESNDFRTVHIKEPVHLWTDCNGVNLLQMYYENIKRWSFTFQINALLTMLDNETKAVKHSSEGAIVVMERSTFSVFELFTQLLSDHVFESVESTIMCNLKRIIPNNLKQRKNDVVLYLRTKPNVCYERLLNRNRLEEIGKVDLEYLEKLHAVHEEKLLEGNVSGRLITIDGSSFFKHDIINAKVSGGDNVSAIDILLNHIHQNYS